MSRVLAAVADPQMLRPGYGASVPNQSESRGLILRLLQAAGGDPWGQDPAAFSPASVQAAIDRLGWMYGPGGYFRVDADGWEHVPASPSMIVCNHSGGTSIPDVWGFAMQWYRHFGFARVLHPLAHELVFSTRFTGAPFTRMGVLRASPQRARDILQTWGRDVMIMPGGDLDTWRPWVDRYRVQFGGRRGYVRTALQTGASIVPVAHSGAHNTLLVLSDGARLAERIGLKKLARAQVFPVHLSLPWGLGIGPMPHWPLPTHLRYRLMPAIPMPAGWVPGDAPDPALVADLDSQVQASVQRGLDELRDERPVWRQRIADVLEAGLGRR